MGATREKKFAALTNFRHPASRKTAPLSRGLLVSDYLRGGASPEKLVADLAIQSDQYDEFNLFLGDAKSLWVFSSRNGNAHELKPGLYGLSNALLDEPWPKVRIGKARLNQLLQSKIHSDDLFALLADREIAHDDHLPQTGVPLEWERRLSATFIVSPEYGTRCSTVLMIGHDGKMEFTERSFDAARIFTGEQRAKL